MMTFEEAKDVFLNHGWIKVEGGTYFDGSKWREAIMILSDYLQRKPCEDAISRTEAISRIEVRRKITCESDPYNYYEEWTKGYEAGIDDAITMINSVSSVTLQQKMGHWIDADGDNAICACCNRLNHLYGEYCKHCGAKMEEVKE